MNAKGGTHRPAEGLETGNEKGAEAVRNSRSIDLPRFVWLVGTAVHRNANSWQMKVSMRESNTPAAAAEHKSAEKEKKPDVHQGKRCLQVLASVTFEQSFTTHQLPRYLALYTMPNAPVSEQHQ